MPGQIINLMSYLFVAIAFGTIASRLVSGLWKPSLKWEMAVGLAFVILGQLVVVGRFIPLWTLTSAAVLGAGMLLSVAGVVVIRRLPPTG